MVPTDSCTAARATYLSASAEQWRDELGRAFHQLAPDPAGERSPAGRLAGVSLGQLATYQVSGSPQVLRRSRRAVRTAPTDRYKVCVQVSGRAVVHQDDREVVVEPGQMALYDTGRPYALRLERQWRCAVLAFPAESVGLPRGVLAAAMERAHAVTQGPGAVLAEYVRSLVNGDELGHPVAAERLGEAGLHLIAGTLSELVNPLGPDAADAMRLQILHFVRTHLEDPGLSHASVATAHHLTTRSLHRLFEHEPCTVTDYIRSQRLQATYRDLTDPLLTHRSIAAIAHRWGFTNQAHFARAFRVKYAVTPSSLRRSNSALDERT